MLLAVGWEEPLRQLMRGSFSFVLPPPAPPPQPSAGMGMRNLVPLT